MRVKFFANSTKQEAQKCALELSHKAECLSLGVTENAAEADVVVALGGDGTILRAVHSFLGIPVLGFNLGGLGFLAAVGRENFDFALECLSKGKFNVSARRMLSVSKDGIECALALNDVVLSREMSGRSVSIDLSIDGRFVSNYLADGLVFATPTGSTAYSLSAGGPILMPESDSFVVTPLNPHALGSRPLVLRDDVSFTAVSRSRTPGEGLRIGVYADGVLAMNLSEGECVSVTRSDKSALLVELEGYDPYDVLARKLGWAGSSVK